VTQKTQLVDGAMLLMIVKGDKVTHYSGNLLLSHMEFVKRTTGTLQEGAWVGTVHKVDGSILAFNSKTFYGVEMPAPQWVLDVAWATFE
jgi:hypothetical protein